MIVDIVHIFIFPLLSFMTILLGMSLYAIPAIHSLPRGLRPGIKRMSVIDAVRILKKTGRSGWSLVEDSRFLVAERMSYCRRNSFDTPRVAFERGYGYCVQQAYALVDILGRLGIDAGVVHAFRNQFPGGTVGGHAWVKVTINGESKYIDTIHYDADKSSLTFTPLTKILKHTRLFKALTVCGEAAVNAHRFYKTGKDN